MSDIRKMLHLIGRANRAKWVLLILLALLATGLEVLGAALVYVLLALVADPGSVIPLPVVGDVRGYFDVDEQTLLLGLAAAMGGFFVIRAAVHVGEIYVQNRVGHTVGARLATKMVHGYLSMPYSFHLHRSSSDLIRNGHQAVKELVSQLFLPLIRVSAEIILVLGMLALLVAVEPAATALAVLIIGGTAVVMLLVIQPRLKRLGKVRHQMERATLNTLQQSFHGVRDVKALGLEWEFSNRYGRDRTRLARASYLKSTASDLPKTVMELALLGFILLIFVMAIVDGEGAGGTLSSLGLFAYAGLRVQPSLQKIIGGLNNLKFANAPLDDLHRDLLMVEAEDQPDSDVQPLPFRSELRLDSVAFRYPTADRDALTGISISIRAGEVIGICGPTGGGKTTLTDIATGLLEPTTGTVTVDGLDLKLHARAWQRSLGIVPQMVSMTDESLRKNIALGVPSRKIDEEAVQEAVHLAQLSEFVASLAEGLDTVVGERGVRISGGQRQRLAIARALYRRPKVLVFDEGTSALDNATEREVMTALERLRGDHTIILVAHRLSTVKKADRIMLVNQGRCDALGTYQELMDTSASFRNLATS